MKELLKKEKIILEVLADIYVFLMILVFPLIVDKTGFFHIFECKWYSYVTISSVYVFLNILIILYFLIFKKTNVFKDIKFSIIQILALVFLGIITISCFISPYYKYHDLFIGVGRGEGLITNSLYILSFLLITLFLKFKKRYILYFSISSILVNTVAVLQYIGFNPFNMFQEGIGIHNVSFMTTIGNVDFISALYCILLTISFCAYVFLDDNKKYEKIIHLVSLFMGFLIFSAINVQSGKVAFLGTMIIIFPFIILNNKRVSRFLNALSTIVLTFGFNILINPEYHSSINRVGLYFKFNYIVLLFIIICAGLYFIAHIFSKIEFDYSKNKKLYMYYYLLVFVGAVVGLLGLYFINFRSGMLYEMHELLHGNFDDNFGTYRIFLWKRTITLIPEYPILGSGPDTFALRFMPKFTNDIMSIGPLTINDTAANVYLTMIINIGIVGLLCYLTFLFFQIKEGIKKINNYSFVFLIAIICFMIQDFFNLALVIVTPIFWVLMAIHFISLKMD